MRYTCLGLDLGTHCGHALVCMTPGRGTVNLSGTWDCSFRAGVDSPTVRIERFERQLVELLRLGVDKVFYENVRRHKGTQAAHIYGAFKAAMMRVCDRFDVSYEGLEVGTVKKFATGKGNANKTEMIAAARTWGYTLNDGADDEADAICIARCGLETRL